jgi:hypothetical protein
LQLTVQVSHRGFYLYGSESGDSDISICSSEGLWIGKLYFYLLTSGTGDHMVYQAMPAYSSMLNPNVEETKDGQGCHYLPPTSHPWGMRQTKVASSLDTTSTLSTTTLASYRVIHLYQGPLLEYPLREWMKNPQANKSKA